MISADSRLERTLDAALNPAFDWLLAHPRVTRALDVTVGRPFCAAVDWWTKRRNLAMRLRACGGRPRWHEGNVEREARLERLAMTGRDE